MPPVNDNLANATVLSGTSVSLGGTIVGSTLENGPYIFDGTYTELSYWGVATVNDGRSAWYKYTAPADANLVFDVSPSGFHPYSEIWVEVAPNDLAFVDWFGSSSEIPVQSNVIPISAGVTIYIYVANWEFDTSEGTFTFGFNVVESPSNDLIANAIRIFDGDTITGTTIGATSTADESAKGLNEAVWYKYKAPSTNLSTLITTVSASEYHGLTVYDSFVGDNADDASVDLSGTIASTNLDPPGPVHQTSFTRDGWVYIAVDPNGDAGTFSFSIGVEIVNDEIDDGGDYLPSQPRGWWGGNNVGATTNGSDALVDGIAPKNSVWHGMTPDHVGTYSLEIERVWGDLVDPLLAVFADPFGTPTMIASSSDTPLPSLTFDIDASQRGDDIAIMVASRVEGQFGGYQLAWNLPSVEPNDDFANATVISGTGSESDKSFDGSMLEIGDYLLSGFDNGGSNHWYTFTPVDDGSIELTVDVGTLASQRLWIWKGTVREELVAIASLSYSSGTTSKIVKVPVEAGETYYIEVYGVPNYTYDISWEINTDAPIDFQPTDVSDFDTNNGASWSSGELVCGPTDYVQHTIIPTGHSRATDSIYIGFNVRYGNSNRMIAGSGDNTVHLLEVYSVSNTLIGSVRIYENLGLLEFNDHLTVTGGISLYKLSEDNIYCEFLINQIPSADYSTTAKDMVMLVQGTDVVPDSTSSPSTQIIGYIKLGYINEPGTAPNLDLRFSDIVVKTILQDEGLPDPPFYSDPKDRLFVATGYRERQHTAAKMSNGFRNTTMATAYTIIDDPTGGGKGAVVDGSSATKSISIPAESSIAGGFAKYRLTAGWWVYLTAIGSGGQLANVAGSDTFLTLNCQSDGTMYIQTGAIGVSATRAYSHRVMETGSWHHFEVEVTRVLPRVEGRWWIDGEEQEPFRGDRATGRLNGFIGGLNVTFTSALRGYLTDFTGSLKERVGPIKSSIISPDASGTHSLGVITHYTEGDGTETFITSTDDGTTYTSLGATDPVHGFIDEWPNNDNASTPPLSDIVGQVNRNGWVEFTYADVDGDEDVMFVNAFSAVRPMHIMTVDFTGLHTYPDLSPHSRDQSDTGAMPSNSKYLIGTREVNQVTQYASGFDQNYRVSQLPMGHAPDGELWTPAKVNSLVARWGYQHFFSAGPQQGNALEAQMMEIITADTVSVSLDEYIPPTPEIVLNTQFLDADNPPYALTSCDAWRTTDKRTDPNMKKKIWLFPSFITEWESFKIYWRITPAYDDSLPNLDGVYANPGRLEDWIWTNGSAWQALRNRPDQFAEKWINNFYTFVTDDIRVLSNFIIYNMCALGDLVDGAGNITFEAFIRDYYDVDSNVATLVVNLSRGDCCGGALMFNKIVPLR